ncbi:MAG: aminoacyl--tRNA ligase-related protein, partial [bacterium]
VEGEARLRPTGKLEEPLVIRPTSETIIWARYKNWSQSYRDLPLLINQGANVVRWEMRTRLLLRTTEYLWQEGHTAHATPQEAEEEALRILEVYRTFAEDYMAMPVIAGKKSEGQKFPGAVHTYTIEAMMQDKKALQAGTSHNLGQNFAKAFDVTFQNERNELEYVYATSWGVSTRLVGALVMTHGDDDGIIIPPRLAAWPLYVVPIYRNAEEKSAVMGLLEPLLADLKRAEIGYRLDDREQLTPGYKFAEGELMGHPLRLEMGPKDVGKGQVMLTKRHNRERVSIPIGSAASEIPKLLDGIQKELFQRAKDFREQHTISVETYDELRRAMEEDIGFVLCHWAGNQEEENRVQEETKATLRVIPLDGKPETGKCVLTGKPSAQRVVFAKAY